jgi:uncharacterized protein YcbK (DUF882 family)
MGDLSANFSRAEFKCNCKKCLCDTVDTELVKALQAIRDKTGTITVVSGHRCAEHNRRVGGAPASRHLLGQAADIRVDGWTPSQVYDLACKMYPDNFGIGLYPTFVHVDVRPAKTRWMS